MQTSERETETERRIGRERHEPDDHLQRRNTDIELSVGHEHND